MRARFCTMLIVAAELWITPVKIVEAIRAMNGFRNAVSSERKPSESLQLLNGAAHQGHAVHQNGEADEHLADVLPPRALDIMMSTTPIIATTGAKFSGLSRSSTPPPCTPERLRIQFVTVVPRLEPMIKLMVCGNCIRPELTRPTSMTVIAEEDWIAIVIPAPSSVLEKGIGGDLFQRAFQRTAGDLAEAAGHHIHTVKEKGQTADEHEDAEYNRHSNTPFYFLFLYSEADFIEIPSFPIYTIFQFSPKVKKIPQRLQHIFRFSTRCQTVLGKAAERAGKIMLRFVPGCRFVPFSDCRVGRKSGPGGVCTRRRVCDFQNGSFPGGCLVVLPPATPPRGGGAARAEAVGVGAGGVHPAARALHAVGVAHRRL